MKAYVIKNKEGKYFAGFDRIDLFTTEKDISKAIMYRADRYEKRELETAPEFKDCSVLEITIAEGDLEQQLRHQVCEEIKKYIEEHNIGGADHISISNQFYKKLDQIEQGENK